MVEVLKHGRTKEKIYAKCYSCYCIFRAAREEFSKDYYEEYLEIECPDCERTVKLDERDLMESQQNSWKDEAEDD